MKKKIIILLLLFIFAFSFTSCKESFNNNDDTTVDTDDVTYMVYFDSNGGTEVSPIEVNSGRKLQAPTNPTKADDEYYTYTFVGWYKDAALNQSFDFNNEVIESSITLYAKWDKNEKQPVILYTVTFISNGGTTVQSQEIEDGSYATEPQAPTKAEDENYTYDFAGWYSNVGLTNQFDFGTPITTSITLYAKWNQTPKQAPEPNKYLVEFNTNGGSSITPQNVVEGEKATKPADPTKNEDQQYKYSFAGWYKDAGLTQTFDFNNETITSAITIYAKWNTTTKEYAVTFNSNGGSAINSQTIPYGSKVAEPSPNPTKSADSEYTYEFVGWFKDAGLTQAFDFSNDTITSAITLYAKWNPYPIVPMTYDVTFDSNGGTTVSSQQVSYGGKVTKPSDPTKAADNYATYTFAGWYKDAALTQAFDFNNDTVTTYLTLFAKWNENPIKYTITFYYGLDLSQSKSEQFNAGEIAEYAVPAITDYSFAGWYKDQGLNTLYENTEILSSFSLYAKYNHTSSGALNVESYKGYTEGIHIELTKISNNISDYTITYKSSTDSSYKSIDSELIRIGSNVKVDIIGLKAGTYSVKIQASGETLELSNITVTADDRSGYAHFNNSTGVGAYNNDGTLKTNAVVVYVTEANKNTVTATFGGKTYTGLANIILNANKNYPLDVRIIGTIGAATWNQIEYDPTGTYRQNKNLPTENVKGINGVALPQQNLDESAIISGGYNTLNESVYSKLNGLTNKIKNESDGSFDSYYNMLDVKGVENVTVEGVGEDACIFQWGFNWKSDCNSIEVKNITFDDYTEDACSFEGTTDSSTMSGFKGKHYWVHNNTFNRGVNYWDVCTEQDKHDGDGATDIKRCAYVTIAYNHYYDNHKTGLVGGGDTNLTAAITFHHNFYDRCQSRLPFARQANMHMYNNYYYGSTGNNMQIYAGAYAFIENCYFENVNNTFIVRENTSGTGTPAVKSYNNIFVNASSSGATVVTNRTDKVANANKFGTSFDTDSSIFYFDSTNSRSNVSYMLSAENVKTYVPIYAGAGNLISIDYSLHMNEENGQYDDPTETVTYNSLATAPTTFGLFYTVLDNNGSPITSESDLTSSTIVTYENDKIYINDTSSTATTIGYYMLEDTQKYTSGTHTYSINLSLSAVGGNWAFIRLLDASGNEFMTIGAAASTKYMCYTYKDLTQQIIVKETAFAANKTYTISLTINYDNDTASLTIDGTTVQISSFDTSSLSGIKFFTAKDAANRSFIVNNIEIN